MRRREPQAPASRLALSLLVVAALVPAAGAHDPGRNSDTHRYLAGAAGDVTSWCAQEYYSTDAHDEGPVDDLGDDLLRQCLDDSCFLEERVGGGPFPWQGIGGACFDIGTDLGAHGATRYRLHIIDDDWNPVGLYVVIRDAQGSLLSRGVGCGSFPESGGHLRLPTGAFRVSVFVGGAATGPIDCLAYGRLGFPGTTGSITLEVA